MTIITNTGSVLTGKGRMTMPDREKVIKGLECCLGTNDCDIDPREDCPYKGMCLCAMALHLEVLELLKEQEPVKAVADGEDSYMCNNCGTVIGWAEWEPGGIEEVRYKFCPECGRQVQWA